MTEPQTTADPAIGDYVLATKYNDGDPGDHWFVGFYLGSYNHFGTKRHLVGSEKDGSSGRGNGFRRVGAIDPDFGEWLLGAAAILARSPAGSVNLWGMQEGTTRALERQETSEVSQP